MFNSQARQAQRARRARGWRGRAAATCAIACWLVAGHARAQVPQAPSVGDRFTEIFNHSLLKQKTIRSIHGRFTETTVSSLLVTPIVAHGTVTAAPPGRVLMTYTDPERKTLALDGKTLAIVWPDRPGADGRQQINISDIQKRVDQYFTHASVDQLRSMFNITAAPDPGLAHTDRIDMRPTRKQIKEGLERLELWIDRDTDMLVKMRLSFPGGDQKIFALSDITLNVPISNEMFRIKY